jgi:hypothetical protein
MALTGKSAERRTYGIGLNRENRSGVRLFARHQILARCCDEKDVTVAAAEGA